MDRSWSDSDCRHKSVKVESRPFFPSIKCSILHCQKLEFLHLHTSAWYASANSASDCNKIYPRVSAAASGQLIPRRIVVDNTKGTPNTLYVVIVFTVVHCCVYKDIRYFRHHTLTTSKLSLSHFSAVALWIPSWGACTAGQLWWRSCRRRARTGCAEMIQVWYWCNMRSHRIFLKATCDLIGELRCRLLRKVTSICILEIAWIYNVLCAS